MRVPESADRDFTATAWIVEDGELLLIKHSKTGQWLPPGGHVEDGETPDETAKREALEETGVKPGFVEQYVPEERDESSYDLPRPFNINLHRIRDGHWHCDFCFLAGAEDEKEASHSHEHDGIDWFDSEELEELVDIPDNVRETALEALGLAQDW